MAIRTAGTLQEAAKAIRALAVSNKEFNAVVNDPVMTQDLVHMLVAKFGGYHATVAKALGTMGAKEYVKVNQKFLDAVWLGNLSSIEDLKKAIMSGFDINFLPSDGDGLLYLLITRPPASDKKVVMIRWLISQGVNVNVIEQTLGNTLLLGAASQKSSNQYPIMTILLDSEGSAQLLNVKQTTTGFAVLHYLAEQSTKPGTADIVLRMLQSGADPSIQDKWGGTPVGYVEKYPTSVEAKKVLQLLEQAEKDQKAKKQ
jgi:hypothetical protein